MPRACRTTFQFDLFAGRTDEDELLQTHSKFWDRTEVLHGVAARGACSGCGVCPYLARGIQSRGLRHVMLHSTTKPPLKQRTSTALSTTDHDTAVDDAKYIRLIRTIARSNFRKNAWN